MTFSFFLSRNSKMAISCRYQVYCVIIFFTKCFFLCANHQLQLGNIQKDNESFESSKKIVLNSHFYYIILTFKFYFNTSLFFSCNRIKKCTKKCRTFHLNMMTRYCFSFKQEITNVYVFILAGSIR
jgi:hypothetical protein